MQLISPTQTFGISRKVVLFSRNSGKKLFHSPLEMSRNSNPDFFGRTGTRPTFHTETETWESLINPAPFWTKKFMKPSSSVLSPNLSLNLFLELGSISALESGLRSSQRRDFRERARVPQTAAGNRPCTSVFLPLLPIRAFVRNHSNQNVFRLQVYFHVNQITFIIYRFRPA